MNTVLKGLCAFALTIPPTSQMAFAEEGPMPGQEDQAELQNISRGSAPGQVTGEAAGEEDTVGAMQTTLTYKSHSIAAWGKSGNLEGSACPSGYKMLSGACHPFYNDKVAIINQFPNVYSNTWRCGFKNNTPDTVTVYIYTLCGK